MSRRALMGAAIAAVLVAIVAFFAVSANATPSTEYEAKAICDHEIDLTEWHFVITQTTEQQAPATIHVTWENGDEEDVPLDKVTGGVAHYVTTSNLDDHVVSAIAIILGAWSGQFNLSHGPACSPPGTTTTTEGSTTTTEGSTTTTTEGSTTTTTEGSTTTTTSTTSPPPPPPPPSSTTTTTEGSTTTTTTEGSTTTTSTTSTTQPSTTTTLGTTTTTVPGSTTTTTTPKISATSIVPVPAPPGVAPVPVPATPHFTG